MKMERLLCITEEDKRHFVIECGVITMYGYGLGKRSSNRNSIRYYYILSVKTPTPRDQSGG